MEQDALKQRIQHGGFDIAYLPIIESCSGQMRGAEALLRWPGPDGNYLPADKVVAAIEGTPNEHELIRSLLKKAAADWASMSAFDVGLVLSINASPYAFTDELVAIIHECWPRHDLLEVEVTERSRVDDYDALGRIVEQLSTMGVRVALDDYTGTVECIGKLVAVEFDHVKLDRSVLLAAESDPNVFREAIWLASVMKRKITAEGVETPEQLKAVTNAGISNWQGFLATPPLLAHQFATWLTETGGRYVQPAGTLQAG